jgi:hypothetical protein
VQQGRGVVGLAHVRVAVLVAPRDAVARRSVDADLRRRADGEDATVLHDPDAIAEGLGLVEVVRGEQDRLAEVGERAHGAPGGAARLGIEAGRRLVEEDELRVADEREGEIQPARLPAGQPADADVRALLQADDLDDLLDGARVRVERGPVRDGLADGQVAVHPAALQDDAGALPQGARPPGRIVPEDGDDAAGAVAVPLEDLDGRRLARAVGSEEAEHLAAGDVEVDPSDGVDVAVGLAQVADEDGGGLAHGHQRL